MKKCFLLLFLFLCIRSYSQAFDEDNRISNEFLVLLKPEYKVDYLLKYFPDLSVKKCVSPHMNIWLLQRNTSTAPDDFLAILKRQPSVSIAQFNHYVQSRSVIPNDTYFNQQWDMLNTGQNKGLVGADIDATDAWGINHKNVTVDGDTIVVAVVDVGFDVQHEDLNFFVNRNEIPNNGIDDDNNGYIDDYKGWSVYDTSDAVEHYADAHSMNIAGIIGAIGNNGIGVAGVCWGAKILRVCASGSDEADIVAGYDYVVTMRRLYNNTSGERGAFIVATNSSFGVDNGNPSFYPLWCAVYDSLGAVGILNAAATANKNVNVDQVGDMPTTCPSKFLIAVTNTTNTDQLYFAAATGKTNIDLGAPGTDVLSTVLSNSYSSLTGTSQATPHVAGAVAAMWAAACTRMVDDYHAHPDSLALVVKQMILDGVTRIKALNEKTVSGGRLNLYNAIRNLQGYNCNGCKSTLASSYINPTCSSPCNGELQVQVNESGSIAINESNLCAGFYPVTVTDSAGCQQTHTFNLQKPDSLILVGINVIAPQGGSNGALVIVASSGNDTLLYSLDGVNYQSDYIFSIDTMGTYTVFIKNETGCILQTTVLVTGIENISATINWQLFPNPATDMLHVTGQFDKLVEARFSVVNLLGETVLQQAVAGNSTSIPLSTLSAGIYFLRLDSEAVTASAKFVVAK